MNEFFLNEHSVHGQYATAGKLKPALSDILNARTTVEDAGFRFYTDNRICQRKAVGENLFFKSVTDIGDKELQSAVLSWLSKSGPFWTTEQIHPVGDLFACMDEDGADSAIAEAACRHTDKTPCELVSFAPSNKFNQNPLTVVWTRNVGGEVDVSLRNYFWELPILQSFLESLTPIEKWDGLLAWAKEECLNILFSEDVIEPIKAMPFKYSAMQQIQALLSLLDAISKADDGSGKLDADGLKLVTTHFTTERGRFSDEKPNSAFNFNHPDTKVSTPCSWHGKVRMDVQYRIHFQWPKPAGQKLWVAYIGPKLTKG